MPVQTHSQASRPIRLVVADDHEALRAGLVASLAEEVGIEVVGEAADGETALALIERRRADVAIVDMVMPGINGLEVVRRVNERSPGVAVLLYTADRDVDLLRAALDAGARGFLVKSSPLAEVPRAVRLLGEGETYIESTLVTKLLDRVNERVRSTLSDRETQVLQLLAQGVTTEAAAQELFLSAATVRSYAEAAMQKLEARNRTHAVAAALRAGLIQ